MEKLIEALVVTIFVIFGLYVTFISGEFIIKLIWRFLWK